MINQRLLVSANISPSMWYHNAMMSCWHYDDNFNSFRFSQILYFWTQACRSHRCLADTNQCKRLMNFNSNRTSCLVSMSLGCTLSKILKYSENIQLIRDYWFLWCLFHIRKHPSPCYVVIANTPTSLCNFPSFLPRQAGLFDWIFLGKSEVLLAHFNNSTYNKFQTCA